MPPTIYHDEETPKALIDFALASIKNKGRPVTITMFAAHVMQSEKTIMVWRKDHEDFEEACLLVESLLKSWVEDKKLDFAAGKGEGGKDASGMLQYVYTRLCRVAEPEKQEEGGSLAAAIRAHREKYSEAKE